MTANLQNIRSGDKLRSNRKANVFYQQYAVYALDMPDYYGNPREIVCLRLYATSAKHYACIWINNGDNIYGYGGGSAGGYGYDKASTAAELAMKNAGIELDTSIDARGESAIKEALKAIAKAIGSQRFFISEAHA